MLKLQVQKLSDWTTAIVELWDGDRVIAEVFARDGGERRLYITDELKDNGLDWSDLIEQGSAITAALDEADRQMEQSRNWLGEI
jgi:hypothetical protein